MKLKKTLRIGLLIEGDMLAHCIFRPLKALQEEGVIEVVCIVKRHEPQKSSVPKHKKLIRFINQKIFKLLDRGGPHLQSQNVFSLFPEATLINAEVKETKFKDDIQAGTVKEIKRYDVDYMLRCGFKILTGGILSAAKSGVLSFHHGDNTVNRGGPALYWEFSQSWENSGVILQLLSEELDGGKVVGRGFGDVVPWSYGATEYRLNCIAESLLYNFLLGRPIGVSDHEWVSSIYDLELYKSPPNIVALGHTFLFLGRFIRKVVNKVIVNNKWSIYVGFESTTLRKFKQIRPGRGEFWADPFPVDQGNSTFIFFECLKYDNPIGTLGFVELGQNAEVKNQGAVDIGHGKHLSFPCVVKEDDLLYMIPETADQESVNLYTPVDFPHKWEKAVTLLENTVAVDTVPVFHNGTWYLFTCHGSLSDSIKDLEMQIYYSERLNSSSWTRHPCSPVMIDVRRARMAGNFFRKDGKLYRPAQDGSIRYGRRVGIYAVEKLSKTEYEESFVRWVEPNWVEGIDRCHTFNLCGNVLVLDASENLPKWKL